MSRTKKVFDVVSFFATLVALSPILLAWYLWDKACGRDFFADLNEEDD